MLLSSFYRDSALPSGKLMLELWNWSIPEGGVSQRNFQQCTTRLFIFIWVKV